MDALDHSSEFSRRELMVRAAIGAAGLGALSMFLSGCAAGRSGGQASLPDVGWPDADLPKPMPRPAVPMPGQAPHVPAGVIPRSAWAKGAPVPALMDRAQRYYRITLHHDGMDVFTSTDRAAAAARLESIRQAHRKREFGDIGYHYLIDPAGRVWQGRPLEWQGAHVRLTNQGNLGICLLGNYMLQRPTDVQLAALNQFVTSQMKQYRVPPGRVFTHRELGPTLCPGDNLQPMIAMSRTSGVIARA